MSDYVTGDKRSPSPTEGELAVKRQKLYPPKTVDDAYKDSDDAEVQSPTEDQSAEKLDPPIPLKTVEDAHKDSDDLEARSPTEDQSADKLDPPIVLKTVEDDSDHKQMDEMVYNDLGGRQAKLPYPKPLLNTILGSYRADLPIGFASVLLNEHGEQLVPLLEKAWYGGSFKPIRNLEIMPRRLSDHRHEPYGEALVEPEQSHEATVNSWTEKYAGRAVEALKAYMNQYHKEAATENYAKYTAILQSSGMGKSRLIDEMSKNTFLIPLCLRKETSGFPPPDKRVADHLTSKCDETECVRRSFAFLAALFDHTANWVKDHRDNGDDYSSLSSRFRSYLVKDQQATMHGKGRIAFYAEVLRLASQYDREIHEDRPRSKTEDINRSTHEPATQDIKTPPRPKGGIATPDKSPKFFFPASTSRSTQASQYATLAQKAQALTDLLSDLPMSSEDGPLMVLAFDESHVLTEVSDEKQGWSFFSCMRRALRSIRNQRCFAFFLSTTGQVFQFTPSKENDRSARVQDSLLLLIPPFTDIGLDQLARKIRENELSIGDVAKIAYMVTLGRPMISSRYKHGDQDIKLAIVDFAAQRLVGSNWRKGELSDSQKLACLAVRLALDFNPDTAEARKKELKQIEHHLRVCMTVSETLDRVKSLPPSEPIIAEAARKVMKDVDTFKPVSALLTEFRRPDVERGPRGETVVMLMATLASDAAAKKDEAIPLVDFLEQLFALPVGQSTHIDNFKEALPSVIHPNSQEKYHNIPLHSAFKDARLNFNHFVKVNDFKTINQKFLWRLIARGAAVLCANCQAGIDFLIPYSYWDQQLGRYNVGVILVQVKNDMKFGGLPREYLFDAMDPIKLGIFDDNGKEPMPVIRIVAALASKDILLRNFKYGDPRNSTAKKPGSSKAKASPTKKTTKATVPEAGSSRARASPRKSAVNASNSRNLRSGSRGNKSKDEHEPLNKNAEETTVPIRRYTAYDFYCGGLHPDVWKPMSKEREDWQSTESIRRSQAPGSATNRSHWSSWTYVDEDGMSDDGGCISAEEDV